MAPLLAGSSATHATRSVSQKQSDVAMGATMVESCGGDDKGINKAHLAVEGDDVPRENGALPTGGQLLGESRVQVVFWRAMSVYT